MTETIFEKKIFAKGWNNMEIEKIINDFVSLYKESDMSKELIKKDEINSNNYVLKFPYDIELFTFLINYLTYPQDFDITNREILIIGVVITNSDFEGIEKIDIDQKSIIYIPEDDDEYDIVYLKTEKGSDYKLCFDSNVWEKIKKDRLTNQLTNMLKSI